MKKNEKILLIAGVSAFVVIIAAASLIYPVLREQYESSRIVSREKKENTSSKPQKPSEETTSWDGETTEVPPAENGDTGSSKPTTSSDSGTGKSPDTPSGSNGGGASSGTSSKPESTPSVDTPSTPQTPDVNYATDFTVVDKNGKQVKLSDLRGKPVVVNIWASWCPPCVNELPHFEKLSKEYAGKVNFMMVNLVGTNGETKDTALSFINQKGYTFPVYFDSLSSARSAYSVTSIPMTLFINADGSLNTQRIGGMSEADLRGYIEAIAGE